MIPLRIEDVHLSGDMAYYMTTTHWLDAMTPPLGTHLQRLCQRVQALLPTLCDDDAPKPSGATASPVRMPPSSESIGCIAGCSERRDANQRQPA